MTRSQLMTFSNGEVAKLPKERFIVAEGVMTKNSQKRLLVLTE